MWGAIIAGVGMFANASASDNAAFQAQTAATINANLTREETREEMRRLRTDISQSEGMMTAMSAASGVQSTGSRALAMKGTVKENARQLSWLRKSGGQKARVIERGGQLQSSQLKSQARSQAFQGFGQIAQGIYSNYNTGG
jgi:hypothetical protein